MNVKNAETVKNRDRIILDKYLPRSKRVRMCLLWAYDMAAVWICACLALGLRFDLDFNSIPASYVHALCLRHMPVLRRSFQQVHSLLLIPNNAGTFSQCLFQYLITVLSISKIKFLL